MITLQIKKIAVQIEEMIKKEARSIGDLPPRHMSLFTHMDGRDC